MAQAEGDAQSATERHVEISAVRPRRTLTCGMLQPDVEVKDALEKPKTAEIESLKRDVGLRAPCTEELVKDKQAKDAEISTSKTCAASETTTSCPDSVPSGLAGYGDYLRDDTVAGMQAKIGKAREIIEQQVGQICELQIQNTKLCESRRHAVEDVARLKQENARMKRMLELRGVHV